jgi:DNA-binding transcriptional regulator YiaG
MKKQVPEAAAQAFSRTSASIAAAVRKTMGMTQVEFADVLGVSVRAVQSYEQGWREIPPSTLRHMFAVLASVRREQLDEVPCWELTGCDAAARSDCRSHRLGKGLFCWLVAGSGCIRLGGDPGSPLKCIDCPVIHRLIKKMG